MFITDSNMFAGQNVKKNQIYTYDSTKLYKVIYRRKKTLCRCEIQYWVEQKLTKDIV